MSASHELLGLLDNLNSKEEYSLIEILRQYGRATAKHPTNMRGYHEGYGILLEEVDELWDDIKRDNYEGIGPEAAQVGAMALRFLVDLT